MENNNMNFGRQLKITRYMIQRAYLEGMLRYHIDNPSKDGDFSERYIGHIFPENILWLKENNVEVHTERITDASHKYFNCEVNVFTISDDITLTEEEIEESNKHCANTMVKFAEENFKELMETFGIPIDGDDDYDDDDDDDDDDDGDEFEESF